jgi:hypothetical protein
MKKIPYYCSQHLYIGLKGVVPPLEIKKNPLSSTTLGQLAQKHFELIKIISLKQPWGGC